MPPSLLWMSTFQQCIIKVPSVQGWLRKGVCLFWGKKGVEMVSFGCGRLETGTWKSTHRCGTGYQNEKSSLMLLFIYEAKHSWNWLHQSISCRFFCFLENYLNFRILAKFWRATVVFWFLKSHHNLSSHHPKEAQLGKLGKWVLFCEQCFNKLILCKYNEFLKQW